MDFFFFFPHPPFLHFLINLGQKMLKRHAICYFQFIGCIKTQGPLIAGAAVK